MTPLEKVEKVWTNVDDEIKGVVKEYIKTRRKYYEKVARELQEKVKEDTVRYTQLLADGLLSKEDYQTLMESRYAQLKIELYSELSISKSRFNAISDKIMKMAINTLIALVL